MEGSPQKPQHTPSITPSATPLKPEGGVAFEAPKPNPDSEREESTPAVSLEEVDRELERAGVTTEDSAAPTPPHAKGPTAGTGASHSGASSPHDDIPSWLADKKAALASQSAPQVAPKPTVPPPKTAPLTGSAPAEKGSSDILRPLRTYKDDIARAIARNKTSKADVSVAEQQRKLVRMEEERAQLALKEKIEQDRARLAQLRKAVPSQSPETTPEVEAAPAEETFTPPPVTPQQPRRSEEEMTVKKTDTYEVGELARQAAEVRGVPAAPRAPLIPRQAVPLREPQAREPLDPQATLRKQESELARRQERARESQPVRLDERPKSSPLMRVTLISFALLILGAGALGATVYFYRDTVSPLTPLEIETLVFAEQGQEIPVETVQGDTFLGLLATRAGATNAPLNAITSLVLTAPDESGEREELTTQEFFEKAQTRASSGLVRSFHPKYMLGVHSFEGAEPFLVFKTSFYENAFAGMLAWERTLSRDLAPLFGPALLNETESAATSTSASGGIFKDRLINNIDTRVLMDLNGDVRLIYSFIDRQTLVIATNRDTFLEVVNRLSSTRVTR